MHIRSAPEGDVPEILHIYNEVIATTTAVYSEQAVTLEDRLAWFRARQRQQYRVIVAQDDNGKTLAT